MHVPGAWVQSAFGQVPPLVGYEGENRCRLACGTPEMEVALLEVPVQPRQNVASEGP